jgi:hypothetical protein
MRREEHTSLSATSTKPRRARRSAASPAQAGPLQDRGQPRDVVGEPGRPLRDPAKVAGVVLLAGLMGVTSWVIASTSTWLVPVYVTAMVLIFVAPRSSRPSESEQLSKAETGTEPAAVQARTGSTARNSPPDPADGPSPASSPSADAAKPRRTRGRARRPARAAGNPAAVPSASTAVTWVRVGPGKFVRADSQGPGPAPAPEPHATLTADEAGPVATGSPLELAGAVEPAPAAESIPVDAPASPPEPAESETSPEGEVFLEEPSTDPGVPSDPSASDPQPAEEHGITPSAFDVEPPAALPEESDVEPRGFDSPAIAWASAEGRIDDRPDRFTTTEAAPDAGPREVRLAPQPRRDSGIRCFLRSDPVAPRRPRARQERGGWRRGGRQTAVRHAGHSRSAVRTRHPADRRSHPHRGFLPRSPPGS